MTTIEPRSRFTKLCVEIRQCFAKDAMEEAVRLENEALQVLSGDQAADENYQAYLVAATLAGSERLVAAMPTHSVAPAKMDYRYWCRLITGEYCGQRPERIRAAELALKSGLGIAGPFPLIFQDCRDRPEWTQFLVSYSRINACLDVIWRNGYNGIKLASPDQLAAVLRVQIEEFPSASVTVINKAFSFDRIWLPVILILSGADLAGLTERLAPGRHQALFDRMTSNHGRLDLTARIGGLEGAIASPERFQREVEQLVLRA